MIYYVSPAGNDLSEGSINAPFKTINHAAQIAVAGDTVKVFGGVYREWVNPKNSGTSEHNRITYEAVKGERPVIKGSEVVENWEKVEGTVWKKVLPNETFGDWNPYALCVEGDWIEEPIVDYRVHLGDVYINGTSLFEAKSLSDLYDNAPRLNCCHFWSRTEEKTVCTPERTSLKWYATVDEKSTTILCNFQNYNPNDELIEINVRPCCFYPKAIGVNYITLRGFEIAHAACPWAPPTSHQMGMVGPHWSKGWIIENNILHDAKCSAISLGKEESTGDNLGYRLRRKSNHRHQLEAVFSALQIGWSRDTIGSHIVRNNEIFDCGQNGVVGHLGCVFSKIEHNHIYNISNKREYWGHERGGIKFHAGIDTIIRNNNIHNCACAGIWLDWQTQGSRISSNILYDNEIDIVLEVNHGPYLIDHNLFMSSYSVDNRSQGGAYVHNLICGKMKNWSELSRSTPYHFPHSTAVAGYSEIYAGDDRYLNNLFIDHYTSNKPDIVPFTKHCDEFTSFDEYTEKINSYPLNISLTAFIDTPQPVMVEDNAYSGYATPSVHEKNPILSENANASIISKDGKWILTLNVDQNVSSAKCKEVTTGRLGEVRLAQQAFENSDGSDIDFSKDINGESHTDDIIPGPFATLKAGEQSIIVWTKNF
ncbi:MAG: right-handed parallel beta-helix repeat-containing protein [Acutalibacteraceae bacterium]|nr:right-handed parallel beta-helix repeat-containing protein [Acutalibacteraceae bacterium]